MRVNARQRRSIKKELIGLAVGVAIIGLWWVFWQVGLITTASTAFGHWFADTFIKV